MLHLVWDSGGKLKSEKRIGVKYTMASLISQNDTIISFSGQTFWFEKVLSAPQIEIVC